MTAIGGLLLLLSLSAQPVPAAPPQEANAPPVAEAPPPAPSPPAWQPEAPRRYGDAGTSHVSLLLGLGGGEGGFAWAGGGGYGYFVLPGLAPGAEAVISGGTNLLTTGLVLGTLRWVPVRTSAFALFAVGRAGRMLVSDHADGWATGAGAGVVLFVAPRFGIELGYDVLALFRRAFCDDLASGCRRQGLSLGLVAGL